jgi:nicotinamidase-related amidase
MPAARRALVVVDVQQEYFAGPLAIQFPPVQESLAKILDALDVATRQGVPVALVQHENPEGAALFAVGSPGWALHPWVEARVEPSWKRIVKTYASCFDHTDLVGWLLQHEVNTLTLVGYMTNNCILATAAAAAPLGFVAEVISDATGAIHLANETGSVAARRLHETLLVLLNSNFAAVATTEDWAAAATAGTPLPKSNLRVSATRGQLLQDE